VSSTSFPPGCSSSSDTNDLGSRDGENFAFGFAWFGFGKMSFRTGVHVRDGSVPHRRSPLGLGEGAQGALVVSFPNEERCLLASDAGYVCATTTWEDELMATILWIIAVILVIAGIAAILRGQMLWGIVLIVVGLLVGPGGVSVFT